MARILCRLLFSVLAIVMAAQAKEALPLDASPELDRHVMAVASQLRCLVCQNESLAASNADLAQDLRKVIREMITQGKSDHEIKEFLVSRYGEFVLYKPLFSARTFALWVGPFLLLLAALFWLVFYIRRRADKLKIQKPLSEEERSQVSRLLAQRAIEP